ncbi:MAG: hypothetical protein R6V40_04700 [Candidatus Moraniibacteriota bacterium]
MFYIFLKIFAIGTVVLLAAMAVNFLANFFGIETWYSFIGKIRENGFLKTLEAKWLHLFFLVFAYPFILGLVAYWIYKFLD